MLVEPTMGQRILCCDNKHPRYGWSGVVRGWNSKAIGVQFEDDADCPPTGRWLKKAQITAWEDAKPELRQRVRQIQLERNLLSKARESALLAVETYNKPAITFKSGGYIVLMIIAWTAALSAVFVRRGTWPYYKQEGTDDYLLVDGEPKWWDLKECLRQYYGGDDTPVKKNLELFIGLRNRIEHSSMPELDARVFGECQALLLNFEDLLAKEFGEHNLLTDTLAYSLQFSRQQSTERQQAMRSLPSSEVTAVLEYVEAFRSSLSTDILNSQEYSFRVFLIPQLVNNPRSTALAVEWVPYDPDDPTAMAQYEKVAALIKTRQVAVSNQGHLKASDVWRQVAARLDGRKFGQYEHMRSWKYFRVRPDGGSASPECCSSRFAVMMRSLDSTSIPRSGSNTSPPNWLMKRNLLKCVVEGETCRHLYSPSPTRGLLVSSILGKIRAI